MGRGTLFCAVVGSFMAFGPLAGQTSTSLDGPPDEEAVPAAVAGRESFQVGVAGEEIRIDLPRPRRRRRVLK